MNDTRTPLNRVVVGIDFGSASVAAAGWTVQCLVRDAELVLVHAVGGGERTGDGSSPPPPSTVTSRAERERAERRLRELRRGLTADFIWCEAREGSPSDTILDVAAEFRADLVVVGAPQTPPGSSDRHDSTVVQLIHRSQLPVIVASGGLQNQPERILVLTGDAAPGAMAAIQCARALGAPHGGAISEPDLWQSFDGFALPQASGASIDPDLIVLGHCGTLDHALPCPDSRVAELLRTARCPVVFTPERRR